MTDNINVIVDAVLKVLRGQRDDKQKQSLHGSWKFNPQIFQGGSHVIIGPIAFSTPFVGKPDMHFGVFAEKAIDQVVTSQSIATGYRPLVLYPYVYGFTQSSNFFNTFYMGLYALTPVPSSVSSYSISWFAAGKGGSYPQQRIDEAWTSSYNKNEAAHLLNDTRRKDLQ